MAIILALGSNQGERMQHLQTALNALPAFFTPNKISRVYETSALLPEGAPAEWNMPYLNAVVSGVSELSPLALLQAIKKLETELGRKPSEAWAPRIIDIDIIAYDNAAIHLPELTVPHPHMHKRDFVLAPLVEIMPDWYYPGKVAAGKTARELLAALPAQAAKPYAEH